MPRSSGVAVGPTILQFCLSTLPFFAVLVFLLYKAVQRGYDADRGYANEGYDSFFSLVDSTSVFLSFHVVWSLFAMHLLVFLPKRRYLLDRYLREGETTLGDVVVQDPTKKSKGMFSLRNYGYVIYMHPTKVDPPMIVRKKVRIYQPWTRERTTILRLPNRPLSGQAKTDIEIDLTQMRIERDTTLCYIASLALFWVLFSLGGAAFCVYQMSEIGEAYLVGNENATLARRILLIVAGVNPFFAFAVNGARHVMYYNWMVHWGASMKDETDARDVKNRHWCVYNNDDSSSFDGSDQIPYSILGEDRSFTGTVPSHTQTKPGETSGNDTNLTVSSVEEDGTSLKVLPWANP